MARRRVALFSFVSTFLTLFLSTADDDSNTCSWHTSNSMASSSKLPAVISCIERVSMPMATLDPWLFAVYHKDQYPAGDGKMQAPRRGNGADFNPSAPYRMYHGDRVPGFPAHPHRGFETVTATLDGVIDHADSKGNSGRYGFGDLQWMTAGAGVQHSEMFPLVHADKPNPTRFFQLWLNLPRASKFEKPAFVMHWAEEIPRFQADSGKVAVTVWAGQLDGHAPLAPPPGSYASNPASDLACWHLALQPGGRYKLPPATSRETNRAVYYLEGDDAGLEIDGHALDHVNLRVTLDGSLGAELHNPSQGAIAEVLVLQGKPIGETVAKHGPFVMNTQEEIHQAFQDYQETRFGGWPWKSDGPVFPADKGRFAELDGVEKRPPAAAAGGDVGVAARDEAKRG